MFTKLEQRSWIIIEVAQGRSTHECFLELHEVCSDVALSYRTMARWAKMFREGMDAVQDSLRTGQPHVENYTVQLLTSLYGC